MPCFLTENWADWGRTGLSKAAGNFLYILLLQVKEYSQESSPKWSLTISSQRNIYHHIYDKNYFILFRFLSYVNTVKEKKTSLLSSYTIGGHVSHLLGTREIAMPGKPGDFYSDHAPKVLFNHPNYIFIS